MKQMQVAQLVEQATENRCVGGSIPPWAPLYENKLINIFLYVLSISSCEVDNNDYFPFSVGNKWLYSIKIGSSYTGKEYEKRLMVTNVNTKKNNIIQVSKLHSDGSYYTYK